MADNRLRVLVFREWENGAPKLNARVYERECLVDEISDFRIEAEAAGYELEAVWLRHEHAVPLWDKQLTP